MLASLPDDETMINVLPSLDNPDMFIFVLYWPISFLFFFNQINYFYSQLTDIKFPLILIESIDEQLVEMIF